MVGRDPQWGWAWLHCLGHKTQCLLRLGGGQGARGLPTTASQTVPARNQACSMALHVLTRCDCPFACRQLPRQPAGTAAAPDGWSCGKRGTGGQQPICAGWHHEQRGACGGRLRSLPGWQRRRSRGCQAATAAAQPHEEAHSQPDCGGRWAATHGTDGGRAATVCLTHTRHAGQERLARWRLPRGSWRQPGRCSDQRHEGAGCQPRPATGPAQLAACLRAQRLAQEMNCARKPSEKCAAVLLTCIYIVREG